MKLRFYSDAEINFKKDKVYFFYYYGISNKANTPFIVHVQKGIYLITIFLLEKDSAKETKTCYSFNLFFES